MALLADLTVATVVLLRTSGEVTLSTAESLGQGLRLASIGPGVVFGEMVFLNGTNTPSRPIAR